MWNLQGAYQKRIFWVGVAGSTSPEISESFRAHFSWALHEVGAATVVTFLDKTLSGGPALGRCSRGFWGFSPLRYSECILTHSRACQKSGAGERSESQNDTYRAPKDHMVSSMPPCIGPWNPNVRSLCFCGLCGNILLCMRGSISGSPRYKPSAIVAPSYVELERYHRSLMCNPLRIQVPKEWGLWEDLLGSGSRILDLTRTIAG